MKRTHNSSLPIHNLSTANMSLAHSPYTHQKRHYFNRLLLCLIRHRRLSKVLYTLPHSNGRDIRHREVHPIRINGTQVIPPTGCILPIMVTLNMSGTRHNQNKMAIVSLSLLSPW